MFSKRILATVLTLSMLFSFGFLVSCSEKSNGPSAPKFETTNQTVPITPKPKDFIYNEFLKSVWETLFTTQFNASTSTFWLDAELTGPGTYTGVNSDGEAYELEVTEFLSYKNTVTLASESTDPVVIAEIQNTSVTQSRAEAYLRVGRNEVWVALTSRSGTESGNTSYIVFPMNYYNPFDNEASLLDLEDENEDSPNGGSPSGLLGLAQDPGFQEDCEEANSKHKNPPKYICYGNRIQDKDCQAACDAAYTSAMEGHISDYCEAIEDSLDAYDQAWDDCEDDYNECLIIEFIHFTLIPAGCIKDRWDCIQDANAALESAHTSLSANLEGDRDGELDTWKDCSKKCCSDPPKVEPKKKKQVELDHFDN